jgi:AcrR family transcriptional regulator
MTTKRTAARDKNRPSGARREIIESAIFENAERLFAERGYAGTTPQDIADAVGVSRQNLYYYVKSKEEILARLITETTSQRVEEMETIASGEGTPPDRLRRLAQHMVSDRAVNQTRFRMLDRSESALPPELAEQFLEGRRTALAITVHIIEAGVAEGWFRAVDARVAALSVIGMCNWVAWWYEPGRGPEVGTLADQIADGAVAMVSREGRAAADPGAVLDSIAEDIERIRAML